MVNHMNLIEKIAVSKGWHIEVKRGKLANLRRWNTIINDSVNEIIAKVACTRPIVPIKL